MRAVLVILIATGVILSGGFATPRVSGAEPPEVTAAAAPIYPPMAITAKVAGEVFVDVEINRDGKVTSAKAQGPDRLLGKVSEEAARRWRFVPAPKGPRERVARMARLTFSFALLSEESPAADVASVYFTREYKIEVKSRTAVP